jgi:hypothetical protein
MKTHSIVLNLGLVTTVGCLGIGYILGGYWWILPMLLAMAIFWITTKSRSAFWSASSLLLVYVVLAIIGVTLNLSVYLMVFGCTVALTCWDLLHFGQSPDDNAPHGFDISLERYHLKSLFTAVFTGLLLAFIGSRINLYFSFGAMIFFVLVAMGCLIYGMQFIVKNR